MAPSDRVPGLDLLRGLAAVGVVLAHLGWWHPGYLGVWVFLPVSGYLIGRQLIGGRPVGAYTRARIGRVVPLWWASVLAAGGLGLVAPADLPWLLAGQVWAVDSEALPSAAAIVWSLGVEEVCYLLAPFGARRPRVILAVVVASLGWSAFGVAAGAGALAGYHSPLTHLWAFGLGVLAATSTAPSNAVLWGVVAGAVGLLAVGVGGWREQAPLAGALGAALVLLAPSLPRFPLAEHVGRRCLGVYLLHPWVIAALPAWAVLPATLAAAEASWWLLERPARRAIAGGAL